MKDSFATIGGGCFWCTEAVFQELKGVQSVIPGYSGGRRPNPSYEQICTGVSGHAEVIQIGFDADVLSFENLLKVFFATHDPTTLNQQGADKGTQYRSVIFYHDEPQKEIAEKVKVELDAQAIFDGPIVTELSPLGIFYPAEDNHQNYFKNNPNQAYCQFVVAPKVAKFRKDFVGELQNV